MKEKRFKDHPHGSRNIKNKGSQTLHYITIIYIYSDYIQENKFSGKKNKLLAFII